MKLYHCLNCGKENIVTLQKSNKYCNNQCQKDYEYKQFVKDWLDGRIEKGSRHIKRYVLELQENKCAKCNLDTWLNKPIVLELEHKDGDSSNNRLSNLECLCPNCHSQTPTYKAKNKGNGRYARRVRYKEGKSF